MALVKLVRDSFASSDVFFVAVLLNLRCLCVVCMGIRASKMHLIKHKVTVD